MISYSKLSSGEYFLALLLKFTTQRSFCGKLVSWSAHRKLLPKQCTSTCWEYEKLFLTAFCSIPQIWKHWMGLSGLLIWGCLLLFLDEGKWDYVNGCWLLPFGNDIWFLPPSPIFWSPCLLRRKHTANFQLIVNVGFFSTARAIPASETKLSQEPGLVIKCLWVGGSACASQLRCKHLGKKCAHLRAEEVHGTPWTPKAHLRRRYAWEQILCWIAYKSCCS